MAISGGDGSIILTTKVDTTGISKGSVSIKSALQGVNSAVSQVKNSFASFKEQKVTLATLTQAIKDQKYAVDSLSVEHAKLVAAGKGSSTQAKELKANIDAATAEMEEMEAAATTLGAKGSTSINRIGIAMKTLLSYFIGIQTIFKVINFSKEAGEFATQTEASVQRLVDIYGSASESVGNFIDANARALGMSKASATSFASVYGNLFSAFADQETNAELTNRYLNMTAVVASKSGRTVEDVQERVRSGLLGNTEAIEDLGIFVNVKTIEMTDAFKRMADGKSWEQLDAYTQQQIRSMAILEQATSKYGNEVADTTATTRAQYKAAYEDFQNTWGQVVNTVLIPVLKTLTQIFTVATKGLQVMAGLSGKTIETSTNKTAQNIEKQKDEQEKLNKAVQKSLAGFDELNVLSEESADNTGDTNNNPFNIPDSGGDVNGSPYVEKVDETLMAIMGIVGEALIAVGLILLFTGNIGWGIGFIIAGAAIVTVSMASASAFDENGVINMLTTIMGIAGGALLAIGIILLWIGGVVSKGVAIGMIVAGGVLIVSAVAAKAAFSPDDIGGWLSLIMGIAGGALLALGIILCMVGSVPIGVGMIIAGSVALVSAVALNFDSVKNLITGWVAVIMGIAGTAMLVLGIILCATGVGVTVGIALIVAGAIALVTPIALNWNAIVDWVKKAWKAVVAFWNAYIAPVFTAKWWKDLGINCINGLIAGFEGGINGIIRAFEKFINWIADGLNKISFDIPDWLGGGHFGFDLSHVDFKELKIPRLARGAVIPPNREFMAVLGDQKYGRNIEAPEDLIRQIVREETANMGGDININFTGSLSRLAQILQPEITRENKRKSIFT